MIRITDATILAYTKLRVHKVRTGLAIGIAGIVFGIMIGMIVVMQGVFDSVARFSNEGLNSRDLVTLSRGGDQASYSAYDHTDDQAFISEVEVTYTQRIDAKKAAAKKYNIPFNPQQDDPSPISIDPKTKQKIIDNSQLLQVDVQTVQAKHQQALYKPFDPAAYLKAYPSASIIQAINTVQPTDGTLLYMLNGKEKTEVTRQDVVSSQFGGDVNAPSLEVLDGSVTKPFITSHSFDASKGEVPVIVPYTAAEKLLGYKKLGDTATTEQKLQRLQQVRSRVGEITASYCYRNTVSQNLLSQAEAQQADIEQNATNKNYVKPHLIYVVPDPTTCGPVTAESDTRTSAEKKVDANRALYQQAIGEYEGEPEQQKVTVRGVGISGDTSDSSQTWSAEGLVKGLLGSTLGYGGTWAIPSNMLQQLPASARLASIFSAKPTGAQFMSSAGFYMPEAYLVEFGSEKDARALLTRASGNNADNVYAIPFGSATLLIDQVKQWIADVAGWVFLGIGGVAMIILAGMVGRSVAEGRRESAIFRAIGASRRDIGAIYGAYTLLLCARIALFAAVLGGVLAGIVEVLFWNTATLGARLAYAASDTTKEFHFIGVDSPYLLWVLGTIFAAGIVASIIPILLGARRNPINDMRNDT